MAIRDVESGRTGGIGAVRYVENGKTVNIPVAYVVEGGKTVLLYKETEDVYTPIGNSYYLYNRGTMSEELGGFDFETQGTASYIVGSDYLGINCPAGDVLKGTLTSKHIMDLSAYTTITIEYAYVDASTGTTLSTTESVFYIRADSTDGINGKYNFLTLGGSPGRLRNTSGFWDGTLLKFTPSSNSTPISSTANVLFKIYSILIDKTTS